MLSRLPVLRQPALRRRGFLLYVVLVVVALLTLGAFRYSTWMNTEYRAADSAIRAAQARALADSGVAYVAALLTSSNSSDLLNGNTWDNPSMFQGITPSGSSSGGPTGRFSVVALRSPDDPDSSSGGSASYRFGLTDESGKINLNALLTFDSTGNLGYQILMGLPNMTDDIANAILDWLDADDDPRQNGAESDYYLTLNPPYHAKNGPLDSLDELLLVRGVTPQLLYGNDRNRNGVLDPDEDDGSGAVNLGWAAYLTVYSRETNTDPNGNLRINLNQQDLNNLASQLTPIVGTDLTNFIIAYRMYGSGGGAGGNSPGGNSMGGSSPAGSTPGKGGAMPSGGGAMSGGMSGGGGSGGGGAIGRGGISNATLAGTDRNSVMSQVRTDQAASPVRKTSNRFSSVWDLVGATVSVTTGTGATARTISYPSPLNDPGQQEQLLPQLLLYTTTSNKTDLTPRINVNTASQTVLQALEGATSLTDADVQNILSNRPSPTDGSSTDPVFQTSTWLLTRANLPVATVKKLDKYLTSRSQVYLVQSVGYFDRAGPVARVEAVIDTNMGRPRILAWRNLSDLGRGFDFAGATR
jgi:type II secretory pathway component PulK